MFKSYVFLTQNVAFVPVPLEVAGRYVRAADLVPGRGKRGKYLIILNLW